MVVPNNWRYAVSIWRRTIIAQVRVGFEEFSPRNNFYNDWRGSRKFIPFVARDICAPAKMNFGPPPLDEVAKRMVAHGDAIKQTTL